MASDISNIIKDEIVNALESLLSISVTIENVELAQEAIDENQCLKVDSKFGFSSDETSWSFLIPTSTATQFEYLMLGGVTDLKDQIDDEISDAVKEIVSTVCGSIATSINAQGFDDLSGVKSEAQGSSVISCSEQDNTNLYKFDINMNGDSLKLFIGFDQVGLSFVEGLTGETVSVETPTTQESNAIAPANSVLSSLLGEDSVENLRLLFDIKLRLSVRLGTKVCLLRDVISWDIGEIIELSQMTSEPLDILVNGVVIGQGEAIIVDGKFGVKIKHIGEAKLN